MKFEWEEISNNGENKAESWWEADYRAKVVGGWLVRHEVCHEYTYYGDDDVAHDCSEEWAKRNNTVTFISDPEHVWVITEKEDN